MYCTCVCVHVRGHYLDLLIQYWASVIAEEAAFSSVYCYCNALPAAALSASQRLAAAS